MHTSTNGITYSNIFSNLDNSKKTTIPLFEKNLSKLAQSVSILNFYDPQLSLNKKKKLKKLSIPPQICQTESNKKLLTSRLLNKMKFLKHEYNKTNSIPNKGRRKLKPIANKNNSPNQRVPTVDNNKNLKLKLFMTNLHYKNKDKAKEKMNKYK